MSARLLGLAFALLSTTIAHAQLSVIHSFDGTDGAWARGTLTMLDGVLYGQTSIGGANNSGTIFSLTPNGLAEVSALNWSYSFDAPLTTPGTTNNGDMPHHNALVAANGVLYGAALFGGNQDNAGPPSVSDSPGSPTYNKTGNGGIYSINPDGTSYTVLKTFNGSGTDPVANDAANEHSPFALYTGTNPAYAGMAFGMSAKGGTFNEGAIYSVSLDDPASSYQVLYSFSVVTGAEPHGQLATDSTGSQLLGMTRLGGTDNDNAGVIFRFNLTDSTYEVVHTFMGGLDDGATNAHGYLLREGEMIYGTTELGGTYDKGVVFAMNEDGSDFTILHSFGGDIAGEGGTFFDDGSTPFGSLILVDGLLYGTTTHGGVNDVGSIFSLSLNGAAYSFLASFDLSITGGLPEDSLTVNADHTIIYGLSQNGGINDPAGTNYYGTIFALPIPEPSTYLLVLLAGLFFAFRQVAHRERA